MWGDVWLWIWFAFPWWLVMLSTFPCTVWLFVCPLWKDVQVLCSFKFDFLFFWGFFAFEFLEFFLSSRYKSFIRYVICSYLLLVCNLRFYSFNSVFCRTEGFSFDEVWFTSFFCMKYGFGIVVKKIFAEQRSQRPS